MARIISVMRYDAPHSIWAAREILKWKPSSVAVELPLDFQPLIGSFLSGKLAEKKFLSKFARMLGRKSRIDKSLLSRGEAGPSAEESFEYIILAAKKAGSKIFAVDESFRSLESEIEGKIFSPRSGRAAAMKRARATLSSPDAGLLSFFEFVHSPFHFVELLAGHTDPERPGHPSGCRICLAGVAWERAAYWAYSLFSNVVNPLGEAKYVFALQYFDILRESRLAARIARIARDRKLGRKQLVLVHLWHAGAVRKKLKRMGIRADFY